MTTRNVLRLVIAASVAAAVTMTATPSTLNAQASTPERSGTQNFHLGLHLNGSAHRFAESDVTESGGGAGLRLGWGATENLLLYIQADGATMTAEGSADEYTLVHVDLGARINFGTRASAWRPYLGLGITGRAAGQTVEGSEVVLAGPAFTGGAGLQYFMTRRLALDVGFGFSHGKYTDATVDGESIEIGESDPATSTRVNLGLSWYPGG